jgi:imidazolonepropionase-like amidohydrolase
VRGRAALATVLALGALGLVALTWPPVPEAQAQGEVVLDPVALVKPGVGRVEHQRIVIRDGRIASIGPAVVVSEPERVVIPGLVDMHVHLPPRLAPGLVDLFGLLFLAHGVTAVREVGSIDGGAFGVAREVAQGARPGPRVAPCGAILDGEPPAFPAARVVRDRAEGEVAVHDDAARGARCVKVYEAVGPEAFEGVRSAALELGLPVIGHAPAAFPLGELPLDDVQHLCHPRCASSSPEEIEAFVEASARRGVAHTPTLVSFEGQALLASGARLDSRPFDRLMPRFWRETLWRSFTGEPNRDALAAMQGLVRRLHARGVRIHAGTDSLQPFVVPGASLHRELELLVGSGLSTEAALAAATSVAGESLGVARLGRIEVGAPADLVVLREDPTRKLRALATIELVIADGRLYPIGVLRDAVEEQRRYLERPWIDAPLHAVTRAGFAAARGSHDR